MLVQSLLPYIVCTAQRSVSLLSVGCLFVLFSILFLLFFFSSRRRHTRSDRDWSSDVCSSDLYEHFARSLEVLPAVRGADVVHQEQVPALPGLACGIFLIDLIDHLYDLRADWVAVAKARVEGQPVLAVEVHEVLAHFRVHSPLVQECDLVEPASLAAARVKHDGAAALPSAQPAVRLPLELDRIRTAVPLDGATVVGAEGFSDGRADVLVVVTDQEPAQSLEALDQLAGE